LRRGWSAGVLSAILRLQADPAPLAAVYQKLIDGSGLAGGGAADGRATAVTPASVPREAQPLLSLLQQAEAALGGYLISHSVSLSRQPSWMFESCSCCCVPFGGLQCHVQLASAELLRLPNRCQCNAG